MLGEGGSCAREGGSSAGEGGSSSWGGQGHVLFNFLALKKPLTPNNINNRSAFALSVKSTNWEILPNLAAKRRTREP